MSFERAGMGDGWRAWARWSGAAIVVLLAHLAGAFIIARQKPEAAAGDAAPAIMVELAPLPVAPSAEPADVVPGPEAQEIQPEPVSEPTDARIEADPPPEPEVDMPPPPDPAEPVFEEPKPMQLQSKEQLQVPEAPLVPEQEVVLSKPNPPSRPPKRPVERPRPIQRVKDKKQVRPQTKTATAPPRVRPAPVAAPAAPAAGAAAASSASPANWRGALLAQLNRAKRYPSEARSRREEGTVRLTFSIDRSGRVTGYRVAGSSGSAILDQEALSMLQRASPLPAPPPEVPGSRISLTVPVRFNLN